jgi:hypothetical protein
MLVISLPLLCIFADEDKDLQEFGKFKPVRSVPHLGKYYPQYAVDGSLGGP